MDQKIPEIPRQKDLFEGFGCLVEEKLSRQNPWFLPPRPETVQTSSQPKLDANESIF